MAQTLDIGSSALEGSVAPDFVEIYIQQGGAGTNILVNSGDQINVFAADNSAPVATLTAGQNQTFTTPPITITSNGFSNITLSGPGY